MSMPPLAAPGSEPLADPTPDIIDSSRSRLGPGAHPSNQPKSPEASLCLNADHELKHLPSANDTTCATATRAECVPVDVPSSLDSVEVPCGSQHLEEQEEPLLKSRPRSGSKFRWTLDAQRALLPSQFRFSTSTTTSSTCLSAANRSCVDRDPYTSRRDHHAQTPNSTTRLKTSYSASPLIPIPAVSLHDRFFSPRTHTQHVKSKTSIDSPFAAPALASSTTSTATAIMRHSASTSHLTPSTTTAQRPMSSSTPPPVPPSPGPSTLSTSSTAVPHPQGTRPTHGKVVRHVLRSFASAIGLKSLAHKDKSTTPPAAPLPARAMSEIGPQSHYSPPTSPTARAPPLLSLPRLLNVTTSTSANNSNPGRVPLPMPYALATADGGAYYQSSGRPTAAPPPADAASQRKRSRGASIMFDGLDWDVRDLNTVLAAIGDDAHEYPSAPPPQQQHYASGALQHGDTTGSSDEDLDRFYDAHAEAYAAAESLSRRLPDHSPMAASAGPSVIHSRNASPSGASTRAMQAGGSPTTTPVQIYPPRRVDSLLAPTLASLAATSTSRRATLMDDEAVGEYPADADSTALLLALPARERFNQSPAIATAEAAAAAAPRRGGTAESYEVGSADAFAGVAAMAASVDVLPPVVPVRTVSVGAAAEEVVFATNEQEDEVKESPKRSMTPPSTSRFVGGAQGTLRRRGATAAGGPGGGVAR